jgi:hypothetical protein
MEMAFAMNACKPIPESALLLSTQGQVIPKTLGRRLDEHLTRKDKRMV